jgi:hypothetical protein
MSTSQVSEATRMLSEHVGYARRPLHASLPPALDDPHPQQTLLLFQIWAIIRSTVSLNEDGPSFLGPPMNFATVASVFKEVGPMLVSPFFSRDSLKFD